MAEEAVKEVPETVVETGRDNSSAQDMELETLNAAEPNSKRAREEGVESEVEEEENGGDSKKQKIEKSVEEERMEKLEGSEGEVEVEEKEDKDSGRVSVGPKSFGSSVEMFDYFYKFLHYWPPNRNVNKYEHIVLLDLLKKGHLEPAKKIGQGICAFQVRYHPQFKSRCFFLVRIDETVDDFSFRKCVDHILPLPENMQIKSDVNKALGGGGRGGGGSYRGKGGGGGSYGGKGGGGRGGGRGRDRGREGKFRN